MSYVRISKVVYRTPEGEIKRTGSQKTDLTGCTVLFGYGAESWGKGRLKGDSAGKSYRYLVGSCKVGSEYSAFGMKSAHSATEAMESALEKIYEGLEYTERRNKVKEVLNEISPN